MNISKIEGCTNCGSCMNTCPSAAVSVEKKDLFYHLKVDPTACTDCGLCAQACPVVGLCGEAEPETPTVFCARHTDRQVVRQSSSGGAFSALAELVLRENGIVFGAAFSEDCSEVVFSDTDRVPLEQLRRSKYVESLVGDSLSRVRRQLDEGRKVLFCGTPCQTAGLRAFLGEDYPNLLCCDFLCGGLPSHRLYQEYLRQFGREVRTVNFRPKVFGWSEYYIRIGFKEGKDYLRPYKLDPYFSAFLRGKCSVRDVCLDCPFAGRHEADLTLADFWGWRDVPEVKNDDMGLSLIAAHTDKGREALSQAGLALSLRPLPPESFLALCRKQPPDEAATARRQAFLRDAETKGLIKSARKHTEATGTQRIREQMKRLLRAMQTQ